MKEIPFEEAKSIVASEYRNKLKSRLYGLLCEREKNGEWEKFLDTIILDLQRMEVELLSINYLILMNKLSLMRYLSYEYFRKNIFECMNLVGEVEL